MNIEQGILNTEVKKIKNNFDLPTSRKDLATSTQ